MEEKMIVIKDTNIFCASFDWSKYLHEKNKKRN